MNEKKRIIEAIKEKIESAKAAFGDDVEDYVAGLKRALIIVEAGGDPEGGES